MKMKISNSNKNILPLDLIATQSAWTNPPSEFSTSRQAQCSPRGLIKNLNLKSIQTTANSSRGFPKQLKFSLHLDAPSPIRTERDVSPKRRQSQYQILRTLASQRRLIESRRGGLTEHKLDCKSDQFFQLQKIKSNYVVAFKQANFQEAINQLVDLLIEYVKQDDVLRFLNTYMLIGDTFLTNGQSDSSIQAYIQTKQLQLCDLLHGVTEVVSKIKPKALIQLSAIAQKLCIYDTAYKLLKKSLQYAWYFHDENMELQCFDKLGKVAYLNANLMKAIYYHNRAQWGRLEPKNSINFSMAISNLKWHFQNLPTNIKGIDGQLVSKATFLPFYFGVVENNEQFVQNEFMMKNKVQILKQSHRFFTLLTPHQLFDQLMNTEEFIYEMPTPREEFQEKKKDHEEDQIPNKQTLNPMETFYYVLKKTADRSEQIYLDNLKTRMKKFSGFVPPQKRYIQKNKETYKLEVQLKKQPLQAVVDERVKRFQDAPNFEDIYKVQKMNTQRIPMKDQIKIGHLSPNRDLEQYGLSQISATNPLKLFKQALE